MLHRRAWIGSAGQGTNDNGTFERDREPRPTSTATFSFLVFKISPSSKFREALQNHADRLGKRARAYPSILGTNACTVCACTCKLPAVNESPRGYQAHSIWFNEARRAASHALAMGWATCVEHDPYEAGRGTTLVWRWVDRMEAMWPRSQRQRRSRFMTISSFSSSSNCVMRWRNRDWDSLTHDLFDNWATSFYVPQRVCPGSGPLQKQMTLQKKRHAIHLR